MSAADREYYKSLPDYDEIREYLDESEEYVQPNFPEFEPDFSSAIIVDSIPIVDSTKLPKLLQVLLKLFKQVTARLEETDVYMPFNDAAGTTFGFCFVKFPSKGEADLAIKMFHNFAMDKKHTFKCTLYSDLDKYSAIPTVYAPKPLPPFKPRPDPTSWLADPLCRDQFVVRYGKETEISWANTTGEEPTVVYDGEREKQGDKVWCDSYVSWSPQGTYLATFHPRGIRLWGGKDFEAHGRFNFDAVEHVEFSPCESYLVTYRYAQIPGLDENESITVWDVRTGEKLRSFPLKNPLEPKFQVSATVVEEKAGKKIERAIKARIVSYEGDSHGGYFTLQEGNTTHTDVPADKVTPMQEPNVLKWSADGKYVARLSPDIIQVYELPSMQLLEKKSIAAKDILDFCWSPKSSAIGGSSAPVSINNYISYWSPAIGNYPALINVIAVPSRADVASRKLFDVTDGKMAWQNEGDYLCVHFTKIQGKKKSFVLMFFRISESGVPVEQIELSEPVLHVAWEPSGDRICIVHGEPRQPSISFYSMAGVPATAAAAVKAIPGAPPSSKSAAPATTKKEVSLLFTLSGMQCNNIFWAPSGGVVALAYYAPDACLFELHDVENNNSLASRRHDRGNRLVWDPSGRFIASCTITPLRGAGSRPNPEDGINVYTFQGAPVVQIKKERLFQFQWRPRPRDLLSSEERKKVIKNLKKYEKMFDKEDRQRKQELQAEVLAARRRVAEEFYSKLHRSRESVLRLKPRRVAIRNGYDSDDERNYTTEVIVSLVHCTIVTFVL
jgi:translation initiation factor 3 subunit B